MTPDELAVRALITGWMDATSADDIDRVLTLMADDVVFIFPKHEPMVGRAAFEAASRSMVGKVKVSGKVEIDEVIVNGDWACSRTRLAIAMHTLDGGAPRFAAGPAFSLYRREPDGRWVLFRDVNMVAPL